MTAPYLTSPQTLTDTFTAPDDTLLPDHDPDTGDAGSWQELGFAIFGSTSHASNLVIVNSTARSDGAGGTPDARAAVHRNNTDPGADSYDVHCTVSFHDPGQSQRYHAIYVRMTATGTAVGDVDSYEVSGNGDSTGSAGWRISKVVGGVWTELHHVPTSLAGGVFEVLIKVRQGSIVVEIDGVETLSTADTDVTQRGRVGISTSRGEDNDHWIDNLTVDPFDPLQPELVDQAQVSDAVESVLRASGATITDTVTITDTGGDYSLAVEPTPLTMPVAMSDTVIATLAGPSRTIVDTAPLSDTVTAWLNVFSPAIRIHAVDGPARGPARSPTGPAVARRVTGPEV